MLKGFFNVPKAVNEPVKSYAPNSPEKVAVLAAYKEMWNSKIDVPLYIGSEEIEPETQEICLRHTITNISLVHII